MRTPLADAMREGARRAAAAFAPPVHDHKHRWYVKGPNLWFCKCSRIGYFRRGRDGRREWVERDLRQVSAAHVAKERAEYLETVTT